MIGIDVYFVSTKSSDSEMANCSEILAYRFNLTQNQSLFFSIIAAFLACLIVIVNSLLAVTLWKAKQLKTSTDIFIFFALFVRLFSWICYNAFRILHSSHSQQAKEMQVIYYTCILFSIQHTSFWVFDFAHRFRPYISVRPNLQEGNGCFKKLKSKFGLIVLTALCFIWSAVGAGSMFIESELNTKVPVICVFTIDTCAVLPIFALYIKMYVTVWRHNQTSMVYNQKGNKVEPSVTPSHSQKENKQSNRTSIAWYTEIH